MHTVNDTAPYTSTARAGELGGNCNGSGGYDARWKAGVDRSIWHLRSGELNLAPHATIRTSPARGYLS